jgi:outer membrane protein assembly factor BamB
MWQRDHRGATTAVDVGTVSYLGTWDGRLRSVNRAASISGWAVALGGVPRGVAKGQNHLYVSATDGYLYSFTTSGQLRWKRALPASASSTGQVGLPVVVRGDQELVVVAHANALLAFHANGDLARWPIALDTPALGSPAVADDVIYVATKKSLYAIR